MKALLGRRATGAGSTCACCNPGYCGSWDGGRTCGGKIAAWSIGCPWKTHRPSDAAATPRTSPILDTDPTKLCPKETWRDRSISFRTAPLLRAKLLTPIYSQEMEERAFVWLPTLLSHHSGEETAHCWTEVWQTPFETGLCKRLEKTRSSCLEDSTWNYPGSFKCMMIPSINP